MTTSKETSDFSVMEINGNTEVHLSNSYKDTDAEKPENNRPNFRPEISGPEGQPLDMIKRVQSQDSFELETGLQCVENGQELDSDELNSNLSRENELENGSVDSRGTLSPLSLVTSCILHHLAPLFYQWLIKEKLEI